MSNKVQEINYFKGVVSHPNSISAQPGTFRALKNGWHIRDGIVDKRPGFSITNPQKAPGFLSQFTGMRNQVDFTFVRQDQTLGNFSPTNGFFPLTGGDTTDAYNVTSTAGTGNGNAYFQTATWQNRIKRPLVATAKFLNSASIKTGPFVNLYDLSTGLLLSQGSDSGTSTQPQVQGMCFGANSDGFPCLYISRLDTNRIYSADLTTIGPSLSFGNVAGNGSTGLGTGAGLTTLALGPIYGITFFQDGANKSHLYACVSNGILDLNITDNTSTLIAGSTSSGYVNATGASARFNNPWGIDYFADVPDELYVADFNNNAIRKVVKSTGVVTTFAGSSSGASGNVDATGTAARFHGPRGLSCLTPVSGASGQSDTVFVTDVSNFSIRQITNAAVVATITGGLNSSFPSGYQDGMFADAAFSSNLGELTVFQDLDAPITQTFSSDLKLFIADQGNSRVRCIDNGPNGGAVSTWAGMGNGRDVGSNYYQSNNFLGYAGGVFNCPRSLNEYGFSTFEFNGTTYLNTSRGVLAGDLVVSNAGTINSNQFKYAGAPQGLDLSLTLVGSPGTLLAADTNVGYRLVWGRKTANGTTILGAPSSEAIISNPSGAGSAKDVQIVSNIPPGIDANWSYQLYRTFTNTPSSASPGDNEFLCFESNPTSTDLANGFVTVTDNTPDALLGAALYTNATQETLSQANTEPPICMDMCLFNGMAIYANTTQRQQMNVNLVGTSAFTNGDQINFVFSDTALNFHLTANSGGETISTGTFQFFTGGTASTNIQNTAQSICRVLNGFLSNRHIRAFYVSPFNGTPGQMVFQSVFLGGESWSITCTAADSAMFSPTIPASGTAYSSSAESRSNGLYISKVNQPDAVPLVNNFIVGSSSESIRRVLPLRTSVILIKERSVWRLTGSDPSSISITLLDNTVSLRADHSASLLNNEVFALTTQGVVAISDNGVRIVSRDIEFQLTQITGSLQAPMDLVNCCWGFGSDDWRTYFLSIFQTDQKAVTWCYSPFANAWGNWDLIVYTTTVTDGQIITACIDDQGATPTNKTTKPFLIFQNNTPMIENPIGYADAGGTGTIATVSGNVVTINYSDQPIEWVLNQNVPVDPRVPTTGWVFFSAVHNVYYYVIADDGAGNLTLNNNLFIAPNDIVTVYRPIDFAMRLNPMSSGAAFNAKQWGDFIFAIESKNAYQLTTGFKQNSGSESVLTGSIPLEIFYFSNFLNQQKILNQLQPDGNTNTPFDADLFFEQVQRVTIPKQAAFGNMLELFIEHSEALSYLVFKAVGLETRGIDSNKVQQ